MGKLTHEQIGAILAEVFSSETLEKIIFGGKDGRTTARPFMRGGEIWAQFERREPGGKVFHKNVPISEAPAETAALMPGFDRCHLFTAGYERRIVRTKDGGYVLTRTRRGGGASSPPSEGHDRAKDLCFPEGTPSPFLHGLGLMDENGIVYKKHYAKFRQINRFLEFFSGVADRFPPGEPIRIADLCCGLGYLSFAAYAWLSEKRGRKAELWAVDRKEDVLSRCAALAERLGYSGIHFSCGDIARFEPPSRPDIVISLHACDTATDLVLANAVEWGAGAILSSPCCHHELAAQLSSDAAPPVLDFPILRQRFAEILTDALRAETLRAAGYSVDICEFVDTEFTHKNLLLRAVRNKNAPSAPDFSKVDRLCARYGVDPALIRLLRGGGRFPSGSPVY